MKNNIYEINTGVFLSRLSQKYGKSMTLLNIPDKEWQDIKKEGFQYIWLMGIWQRSLKSKTCAMDNVDLTVEYDRALPGWHPDDVSGSPYSIKSYGLNPEFGDEKDLRSLRIKLNKMGFRLILDFTAVMTLAKQANYCVDRALC